MKGQYNKYDEDYKKSIVKMIENGKSVSDISREYGIGRSAIYSWIKKYETITTTDGLITCNDDIDKLKKELKNIKEENEILKKAVAIFTKK